MITSLVGWSVRDLIIRKFVVSSVFISTRRRCFRRRRRRSRHLLRPLLPPPPPFFRFLFLLLFLLFFLLPDSVEASPMTLPLVCVSSANGC